MNEQERIVKQALAVLKGAGASIFESMITGPMGRVRVYTESKLIFIDQGALEGTHLWAQVDGLVNHCGFKAIVNK